MTRTNTPEIQAVERLFQTGLRFHQEGKLQRAEHLYRETLRQRPQHADALNMLGVIACQTRNFVAGAELITRALSSDPSNADFNNNLGMAQLELKDSAAAEASFARAIAARPRFAEAHFNLANVLLALNQTEAAEQHYRKALRARPDYVDALNNLGNLLRQTGRAAEATPLFHKLVRSAPNFAEGHFNLALSLQIEARLEEAIAEFKRALAIDSQTAGVWEALGHCHRQRGAFADAESAYAQALALTPTAPKLWNALGLTQYAQNRALDARASFERALEFERNNAMSLNHLGMAHAALGDRTQARRCFEQAVHADPGYGEAYRNLAELKLEERDQRALVLQIEAQLARADIDPRQRIELEFARGKIYDDLNDFATAFQAFAAANRAKHALVRFDADAQAKFIDALIETFDAEFFSRNAGLGTQSAVPVFIIGMPRSGTTLVEQILASHPAVFGAGELTFFPEHVPQLGQRLGRHKPFPACLAGGPLERMVELGTQYLDLLTRLSPRATRVTDKMPYNFLYLGVIATLFPAAKIVHCRRQPMATCFSIYTRDLAGNHPYSYDFTALGAAYNGYHRLMAHWRSMLGPRVLDVDYESLVMRPEPEIRKLIDHVGLAWNPACLQFHRTERAVMTASQWQVRQPLYQSAREHWRAYAEYLTPLAGTLGALAENPGGL